MPSKKTIQRAQEDRRQGKSASTQAGEFVREEIHHVREGKHGARSPQQAIAIGLSKARRAGVDLPPPDSESAPARTRRKARQDQRSGQRRGRRKSAKRSRASTRALGRERRSSTSRGELGRQARSAASRRSSSSRSAAARKASRSKGAAGRRAAARKAARTRSRRGS